MGKLKQFYFTIKQERCIEWKRIMRRMRVILAAWTVLAICFCTGCKQEEETRFPITMMMEQFSEMEASPGGVWLEELEKYTDTDLQFQMVPTLEYVAQTERLIRSDGLPMVIAFNKTIMDKEAFYAYVRAGGFWELDDYLDDYPALKEFVGDEIWEGSRIHGHIYGIPRLRIRPRYAAYYRADWAEKLGIKPPQTLDEIYEMLKAFTEQDPDGNGIADTVGLVDSWQQWRTREWNGIQNVTTALGGPNGWEYDEEEAAMVPDFATEEYMEAMNWFKSLYQAGYLENTFSFLTPVQRQELFIQGRAGMIFGVIDDAPQMEDEMRELNPKAKVAILPLIRAEGREYRVNSTEGHNGLVMFNRIGSGAIKSEEELRRVLEFYNSLCEEEGQDLLLFGKEGKYHVVEPDGQKRLLCEEGHNKSILAEETGSYYQIMPLPAYTRTAGDSFLQQEVYDQIEEREQWLVLNDALGLYSETYSMLSDTLNRRIKKASMRYMMGEITETDYWKEYKGWYEEGGKKVIEEYTRQYLDR